MPEKSMRAACVHAPGSAADITVETIPVPDPGPTDVLVQVEAVSVNPVDTYVRSGQYPTPMPTPFVVGRDLVGTVVTAGPGTGFETGEQVWSNSLGYGGRQGPCAEYAVVPADRLYRRPEGTDPVTTVAALHTAATACLALHRDAEVRAGQTIFIGGSAGNIGAIAVQLAHEAGLRVIASARSDDHEAVRDLGADTVLDYRDPGLAERVLAAAPGGVDVHWDTSGKGLLADALRLVAARGRIILTAGRQSQDDVDLWPLYTRDVRLIGFVISLASVSDLAAAADTINRRLAGPGLPVRVTHELPLSETARGHELVESGTRGRVVIRPGL
jgi:2-desacetyl-2-hydroxyethyl bacteriochlorophyllide A dehydrogenase